MTTFKIRADQWLVNAGLASSRAQAARLIKAGAISVRINKRWQPVDKPSAPLSPDAEIEVQAGSEGQYVSRGALKLEEALRAIDLDCADINALDVGQSTGGFTDFLLQSGAARVVGVDVGHEQLAERLRTDPRVVCLEGINARSLDEVDLLQYAPAGFDLIVMDVSFISQTLIVPNLPPLMRPGGWLVSLVKPQFEVGRDGVGKGGLVRDETLFPLVQTKIEACVVEHGLVVERYIPSPITGGDGNREFLLAAQKPLV